MKDKLRELAGECRKPYPEGAHGTRYADGYNDAGNDIADRLESILDAEGDELPDDIRVPLDEVWADLGYLFGRVAADGSFMQAAIDSVRMKLYKVRAALESYERGRK